MLALYNIKKQYKTGGLTQMALNDVSLSFRDNEFVSILGPSGSGKTTLLNIIGGLDHYDSGELVINGKSTRKYSDRDWDTYRNHSVGFVFQSYNLIPHQSVLANVELALTIGGISGAERKKRAAEALKKVGLEEHIHKRPNQLSGGQMQRVAIARALVNNPSILLADEPTGALDSETSVQVMELLKEVARDRLVIMVTHNPELAEQYATRIVRLKDGKIIADSNPCEAIAEEDSGKKYKKSSMRFRTSLALSFNNLRTKFTRTLLIAIAGSIGIIGIALIMSLSNGVNKFIQDTEEETLKGYPLTVTGMSLDVTSMMTDLVEAQEEENNWEVKEMQTISSLFSSVATNDLADLKEFIEEDNDSIGQYINATEYTYNVTPVLYIKDGEDYRQVNPDTLMESMGYSSTLSNLATMFSSYSSMDTFSSMPENEDLYTDGYEVMAGKWPENYNECVLVLSADGYVSDMVLYALNMKDASQLEILMTKFLSGESVKIDDEAGVYQYSDFIGKELKIVNACDMYTYDESREIWVSNANDTAFMNSLCESSDTMTLVGVVKAKDSDTTTATLSAGLINYPMELIYHYMETAAQSEIVKEQLANPEINVITGESFESEGKSFTMEDLFQLDFDALADAFQLDTSSLEELDLGELFTDGSLFDEEELASSLELSGIDIDTSGIDMDSLLSGITLNISQEDMSDLFTNLLSGYEEYSAKHPSDSLSGLPAAIGDYMGSEEAGEILSKAIRSTISSMASRKITQEDMESLTKEILSAYENYLQNRWGNILRGDITAEERLSAFFDSSDLQTLLADRMTTIITDMASEAIPEDTLSEIGSELISGYNTWAEKNNRPSINGIMDSFAGYLSSEEAQNMIGASLTNIFDTTQMETAFTEMFGQLSESISSTVQEAMGSVMETMAASLQEKLPEMMESVITQMIGSLSFDTDTLTETLGLDFTEEELASLMESMFSTDVVTLQTNLQSFGYADEASPNSINIYPKDFESKTAIKEILDNYNEEKKAAGKEDQCVSYTDLVGILMTSVTTIVNAISYVLIAFVAISLVVSSIMIGVITYISVLERKKEIGILRAIGASKRNISQVFNAETIIIGALAGIIGVGFTWIVLGPANIILRNVTNQDIHAHLPIASGLALILLSILLTLIGGLLPAKKASRQDPVVALRTE